MKTSRVYRMGARGEAVEQTRSRILGAVETLATRDLDFDPTLDAVAAIAGVSVQTVLRHFGTRDRLLDAAIAEVQARVVAERRPAHEDVDAALAALLEHYEHRGDFVLAMLGREASDDRVAAITAAGKRLHRSWVADVFASRLPEDRAEREAALDLLVVATDVYAWKLLRRDRGHSLTTVHARMRALTDAVLAR